MSIAALYTIAKVWKQLKCPSTDESEGSQGQDGGIGRPVFTYPTRTSRIYLQMEKFTAELLTPVPSGCLHAAYSSPLPGFVLLTPCFSTQPQPASADTSLRLGRAGLWHRLSMQVSLCPACHGPASVLSSASPQSPPSI